MRMPFVVIYLVILWLNGCFVISSIAKEKRRITSMQIYLFVVACAANLLFRAGNLCSASNHYLSASSSSDGRLSGVWGSPWSSSFLDTWTITAPYGQKVLLNFDRLLISYSYYCASYLEVRDGRYSYSPLLTKQCNSSSPISPVYSSGRYLYVRFYKTYYTSGGISATFRALSSSSACPNVLEGNNTGVIYSPGFPFRYPDNKDCSWIIGKSYNTYLLLNFTVFDLESGCYDKVVVRNGRYSWSSRQGQYCSDNSQAPFVVTLSRSSARVEFTSDYSGQGKGFLMFYRFLDSQYRPSPTPSWWTSTSYPWYTDGWWTTPYWQRWTTRPYWEWTTRPYWERWSTRPYWERRPTRPYWGEGTVAPHLDSTRHTLAIVLPIVIGVVLLVIIILIFMFERQKRATNRAPVNTAPPPSEIPLQVWPQQVRVPSTTFPAQQRVLFVPTSTVGTSPGASTVGIPTAPLTSSTVLNPDELQVEFAGPSSARAEMTQPPQVHPTEQHTATDSDTAGLEHPSDQPSSF